MDEQTQAEQYARTGNLMDLCNNEAWVREVARIEDECGGNVGAGISMRGYEAWLQKSSSEERRQMQQRMRLQSILFSELHAWMQTWGLGVSFEETYTLARRLVRDRLEEASPEQATWIEALLAEDLQELPQEKPVRGETVTRLTEMLTLEDWRSLAAVASRAISAEVLRVGDADSTANAIA